jgi:hypothetical protein
MRPPWRTVFRSWRRAGNLNLLPFVYYSTGVAGRKDPSVEENKAVVVGLLTIVFLVLLWAVFGL